MEEINKVITSCDFIIEKLGETETSDLQILKDYEVISKSVTLELIIRINKLLQLNTKDKEDSDEIELYKTIKAKLKLLQNSNICENIKDIIFAIKNRKYHVSNIDLYLKFIKFSKDNNKSFIKSEEIEDDNLRKVCSV